MKAKEKKKVKINITIKNIIYFAFLIIIVFDIFIFYNLYFQNNESYALSDEETTQTTSQEKQVKISNANKVDIDTIISNNMPENKSEQLRYEDTTLEYLTQYITNSDIPTGESYIVQEGVKGTQRITYKKIYENGNLIGEEQVSVSVIKPAFNQIIEIGGGAKKATYNVKVGDEVYVTSDELTVYISPEENAEKTTKLHKDDKLNVLKIQNGWYYISCGDVQGWVRKEATKYIQKEEIIQYQENETTTTKSIQKLDFNMNLNKPSGLTLEQFKKVLSDEKDINKVFEQNAQYFYYIEQQYNINGLFVAAIGIHESAWGTSKIAKDKKNLFGYGAYDSNPYNGAYNFTEYAESIDLIARVLVKYYLNPKGTSIYNGETAAGTYYTTPTLTGVNNKYATDKNWANAVYSHMKYLYNKL